MFSDCSYCILYYFHAFKFVKVYLIALTVVCFGECYMWAWEGYSFCCWMKCYWKDWWWCSKCQYFGHLMQKANSLEKNPAAGEDWRQNKRVADNETHWKRPWCWERSKATVEEDGRKRDGWIVSLTQWTWSWGNSGR